MPSYLGEYPGSRSNPINKFVRAVNSFIANTELNKELIIVSDGCSITNEVYNKLFRDIDNIRLISVEKSEFAWPGELRECGRSIAKYDWIAYLDADDAIVPFYTTMILDVIKKNPGIMVFQNSQMLLPIPNDDQLKKFTNYLDVTPFNNVDEFREFRNSKQGVRASFLGIEWIVAKASSIAGTWCIVHNKYVASRWGSSNQMGEDINFLKELKKNYDTKFTDFPGYLICHITKTHDRSLLVWEV